MLCTMWLVIKFTCVSICFLSILDTGESTSPSEHFHRFKIVRPTVLHGRTKRELETTKSHNGEHHPGVVLIINIDGVDYVLDLQLNEDLVTEGHTLRYQKDGETVEHKPTREEVELCQYQGAVRGRAGSWAAVSTCRGLSGAVFDGDTMRYIEPAAADGGAAGGPLQASHYVYSLPDLNQQYRCGYSGGVTNNSQYDPELAERHAVQRRPARARIARHKRGAEETLLRGPFGANKRSRYVELVLVADQREFRASGDSVRAVHANMIQVANIINSVYAPLNIFIALVGVVVWNERDEILLEENGDNTLKNFLKYREELLKTMPNDNAQLITQLKFLESVVGKSLVGPICSSKYSGGVNSNVSLGVSVLGAAVAHSLGHNLGMVHDIDECSCPEPHCIMSPAAVMAATRFSSCSVQSLQLAFDRGMDYCLRNKPRRLAEFPDIPSTCGNGFVEAGEQCDCGLAPHGACAACCEPRSCRLRHNATCATGRCCDTTSCRVKRAGAPCRGAEHECDLPEYCTGHSEFCPADVHRMDSTPCGGGAYCARGSCRSHSDQCRVLWGATGETSHDKCYNTINVKGNGNGNCGFDRVNSYYKPCEPEDVMCGTLQCRHLNERLEFGLETVAILRATFIAHNGSVIACRSASIDMGAGADPGMVPDGAACGDRKMCMNQKCVPIDEIRASIAKLESSVCPSDCSGHGVCNSLGHCHCEPGFAPPLCEPAPGGSVDSGPATAPSTPASK